MGPEKQWYGNQDNHYIGREVENGICNEVMESGCTLSCSNGQLVSKDEYHVLSETLTIRWGDLPISTERPAPNSKV
jgi:hypothetical protein